LQNFNGLVVIDEAYIDFSKKQSCGMNWWISEFSYNSNLV
jgi:histidinol-phosphate/aromatic aminotransferase/cobyric acid decarboxylase-like protein